MARWIASLAALAALVFVAIGCSGGGETPVTPGAFIRITAPNGGEQWLPGTDQEITWVSQYIDGTVFIEYTKDDFVSDVNLIAVDEPNDGSYTWEDIPPDLSHSVRVKISWTQFPSVSDTSDADFAIVGPWIQVLTPNGGEIWGAGGKEEITWASLGVTGTVFIEYSKDNFASDTNSIAADEPNDGSFTWNPVPADFSDAARVRVSWTDYPDVNDISDSRFSIVDCGWARTWRGSCDDRGIAVASDGNGSIYVTGEFSGTADFDPDGGDLHSTNGCWDAFLSKFDSSGNFEWARTWGGSGRDSGYGVAADDFGNVYVTGRFYGTADFDPDGGDPHNSNGAQDVFLSKFDSSGDFRWARTWGGSDYDDGFGVAADASGNVYATGCFEFTVDFNPDGGDPHTFVGFTDVFLSKFDSSGDFEWARTWGGSAFEHGRGVAAGGSGSVYVTGDFGGTVDFDPGGGDPHTSNSYNDAFLSKFDSSGNFEWARTWGGPQPGCGWEVAADSSGNVYVTGEFRGTADFNPDGGDPRTSNGHCDAFLSRFDSSGSFVWVRTWGGSEDDSGEGVATDGSGNVYVAGWFRETVDFDPGGGDSHTSGGWEDVFLSKFNSMGDYAWARTWGSSHWEQGYGVAADDSGSVYVTGDFWGWVDFAPGDPPCNEDQDAHTSYEYYDAFLVKYLPDGCW